MTAAMSASVVAERLDAIRDRIARAGGDTRSITVVAMTKGFGIDAVRAAIAAGLHDLGENYAQELVEKAEQTTGPARWHFLGAVQRNKVAKLAPRVSVWQTVDRMSAGTEIARRSRGATVLVQVNLSGDPGRNGCSFEDAPALVGDLRGLDLDVAGLMGVASAGSPDQARAEFERLGALRRALELDELSIGMTDDLELAVAAGSTMVRIGRALFGERDKRPL
ncbi:MAG TPA: YggS family pyridoxal phosphate-dependent enzyme [Acidimicrobiales bacterium]|jgi:PLP dependent protein|nr:YggS family pyridoxal phosphate-dependent enzyme [Acidimicrobiales bacterium]